MARRKSRRGRPHHKTRSRKRRSSPRRRRTSGRRRSGTRRRRRSRSVVSVASGSLRRRRRSRASNPPRRRRRRSHSRRRNAPRTRIRHVHHRSRRRNPPYSIKTVIVAVLVAGAGFAAAKLLPYAIAHFTGDPSWNQGWMGVGLHAGSSVVAAGIGYGVLRLMGKRQSAKMVGGELLVGGLLATGFEAFHMIRQHMGVAPSVQPSGSAPGLVPAGQRGMGMITPQQVAQAQQAARIIQQRGMGNLSPAAFGAAHASASSLFSPNEKF